MARKYQSKWNVRNIRWSGELEFKSAKAVERNSEVNNRKKWAIYVALELKNT